MLQVLFILLLLHSLLSLLSLLLPLLLLLPFLLLFPYPSHPLAVPEELEEQDALGVRRAAQRRLELELGVTAKDSPLEKIHYLTRIIYSAPSSGQWGEHELDYILFLRANPELVPDTEEVKAVEWVGREHLQEFLQEVKTGGGEVTPWFQLISQHLLPQWWSNLERIEEFKDRTTIHRY